MGSDNIQICDELHAYNFNPRSRVGSDALKKRLFLSHGNFNPRSRVGSDCGLADVAGLISKISIHAPAWGATAKMHKFYAFLDKITIFRELNGDFAWF